MNPRRGDQHGHFLDELQGIEHQVRRAIASRMRQLVKTLALRAFGQPPQRNVVIDGVAAPTFGAGGLGTAH
jgi:hypothetical protein